MIDALFEEGPRQWGLRGDPFLWREMAQHLAAVPLPPTEAILQALLEDTFATLTGKHINAAEPIFLERFDQGGMSSGLISPAFWREKGIPLLCARYMAGGR